MTPGTTQFSIYTNNNDETTATTIMPRFNNCNINDVKFNNCNNNDAKV